MAKARTKSINNPAEAWGGGSGARINSGGKITRLPVRSDITSQNRAASSYKTNIPTEKSAANIERGKALQQSIRAKGAAKAAPGAAVVGAAAQREIDKRKSSSTKSASTSKSTKKK